MNNVFIGFYVVLLYHYDNIVLFNNLDQKWRSKKFIFMHNFVFYALNIHYFCIFIQCIFIHYLCIKYVYFEYFCIIIHDIILISLASNRTPK